MNNDQERKKSRDCLNELIKHLERSVELVEFLETKSSPCIKIRCPYAFSVTGAVTSQAILEFPLGDIAAKCADSLKNEIRNNEIWKK